MVRVNKISWFRPRLGPLAAAAGLCVVFAGRALAEENEGLRVNLAELDPVCVTFFETGAHEAADQFEPCAAAMEARWGADDPRMVPFYLELSAEMVVFPKRAAIALPVLEKADALAVSLHGEESAEAAETGLTFVRTLIVAGRCEGLDPAVGARLDRARVGYQATSAQVRTKGLRGVASAYADAKFYDRASETMLLIGEDMIDRDWLRLAAWRKSGGDALGAEQALWSGLEASNDRYVRARMLHLLKVSLFERGAIEEVAKIPSE